MVRAPCCEKEGMKKGRWTDEEDDILIRYIQANGEGSWRSVPKNAGLQRCGKSCRLRWINYLRPDLKRGNITAEEEVLIIKLHASMGNRWSLIAGHLPGRTDNEIKNYWNSHLSRKILTYPKTASKLTVPEPKSFSELTADWNPRRGRSRKLTIGKISSLVPKDTKLSASISENEELEPVTKGKIVEPDTSKESFEVMEYINDEGEGEDNTSSQNAEDSLILTSAQRPAYYNDALIEIVSSLNDLSNMKAADVQTNLSTHNKGCFFLDQNNGSKPCNKVADNTCATSWNGSKNLSLTSPAGDTWSDWDWKGIVNCHKRLDEEEMLSMLWDDCSNLKCNN